MRLQEAAWCVGPDWLVRQLPQFCVLTGCGTTFGIPYVSFLLLCRFSHLSSVGVSVWILRLPWSFRQNGTGARSSVFCYGIGLEWFQTELCFPPGERIVTVASKCWRCVSSETSPLRVYHSSHSLAMLGISVPLSLVASGRFIVRGSPGGDLDDGQVGFRVLRAVRRWCVDLLLAHSWHVTDGSQFRAARVSEQHVGWRQTARASGQQFCFETDDNFVSRTHCFYPGKCR